MDDPDFIRTVEGMHLRIKYRNSADLKKLLEESSVVYERLLRDLKIQKEEEKK